MEFFLFVLGVVGMTHIIVDASIFQWLRDLFDKRLPEKVAKGIHCYQCTGFWCGLFCGWALLSNTAWWPLPYFEWLLPYPESFMKVFVAGCAGSLLANFMAIYMNYLEAMTFITLPSEKEE